MEPALKQGRLVIGYTYYRRLNTNDVVIFQHEDIEKIKRIQKISANDIYVLGDNSSRSSDSRHFGPINKLDVIAKVLL